MTATPAAAAAPSPPPPRSSSAPGAFASASHRNMLLLPFLGLLNTLPGLTPSLCDRSVNSNN